MCPTSRIRGLKIDTGCFTPSCRRRPSTTGSLRLIRCSATLTSFVSPPWTKEPLRSGRGARHRVHRGVRYDRLPDTDDAEVAFVVADAHQGRGISSVMLG